MCKSLGGSLVASADAAVQVCVGSLRADLLELWSGVFRCHGERVAEHHGPLLAVCPGRVDSYLACLPAVRAAPSGDRHDPACGTTVGWGICDGFLALRQEDGLWVAIDGVADPTAEQAIERCADNICALLDGLIGLALREATRERPDESPDRRSLLVALWQGMEQAREAVLRLWDEPDETDPVELPEVVVFAPSGEDRRRAQHRPRVEETETEPESEPDSETIQDTSVSASLPSSPALGFLIFQVRPCHPWVC